MTFRKYDNGDYKDCDIITRHPNIVFGVIKGKKSWGLFKNEWSDGICDCLFTKEEIIKTFTDQGIEIPSSLMKDFDNTIERKKRKKYLDYLNQLIIK